MDRQETELVVLARIPDLGNVGRSRRRGWSLASRGRLIGQALSFKLLATAALLLVAMALVPLTVHTGSPAADSPPTAAVVAAPGYELHYTWVLAGEERRYGAWVDDPRHAWTKNT